MRDPGPDLKAKTDEVIVAWAKLLDDELSARTGGVVQAGPFKGLRLMAKDPNAYHVLNLLGAYERELHPGLERLLARSHPQVVNIGAADGFYTTGLALRQPEATVLAYEMRDELHSVISANAAANRVLPRIALRGACSAETLTEEMVPGALLFSDCEGAELDILDPAAVPALKTADMIVELHDIFRDGLTETLIARFAPTHDIEIVAPEGRDDGAYPLIADLPQFHRMLCLCEYRPPNMSWGVFTPKAGTGVKTT